MLSGLAVTDLGMKPCGFTVLAEAGTAAAPAATVIAATASAFVVFGLNILFPFFWVGFTPRAGRRRVLCRVRIRSCGPRRRARHRPGDRPVPCRPTSDHRPAGNPGWRGPG